MLSQPTLAWYTFLSMAAGSLRRAAMLLATGAALALAVPACGDDDDQPGGSGSAGTSDGSSESSPAAGERPVIRGGAVAAVGGTRISRAQLDRRTAAVRRATRSGEEGVAGQAKRQALTQLLQEAVLEQEARRRKIRVSAAEVRRRYAVGRKQFKSDEEFAKFLGASTRADVLHDLRLQLLSTALVKQVNADGDNGVRFVQRLQSRWRGRTACRKGYVVPGCRRARTSKG